jgi:hypothetical protein
MSSILRRLPFFDDATSLQIPGGPVVSIKHDQIVAWVSVTLPGLTAPSMSEPRFPALLDTGFNDTFLLQEEHLMAWSGHSPGDFHALAALSVYGTQAPLLDADVWLHRNEPGERDVLAPGSPFRLELEFGIAVCPRGMGRPRLPLLGVKALRENDLTMLLSTARRRLTVRHRSSA